MLKLILAFVTSIETLSTCCITGIISFLGSMPPVIPARFEGAVLFRDSSSWAVCMREGRWTYHEKIMEYSGLAGLTTQSFPVHASTLEIMNPSMALTHTHALSPRQYHVYVTVYLNRT